MTTADGSVIGNTKIVDNGDPALRWNLVIVGDGYMASELSKYETDVQDFVDKLKTTPPFDVMWEAINVYRVNVSSTDSGADDPTACGGTGATPATYFDSGFCNSGIRRLLIANGTTAQSVATTQVPQMHQTLVIVNSSIYGGAGGSIGTFSTHASAAEIGIHELGHSAFGLADEYEYYAGCGSGETGHDSYTGSEPAQPNVTTITDRLTNKWRDLILAATPMPSSTNADCSKCDTQPNPLPVGTVGTFEGGKYFHCGIYRPEWNCMMKNLGQPFCAVCKQVIQDALKPFMPSKCYIATAAYGSELEPTVQFLRGFRDDVVLESKWKSIFKGGLRVYYKFSPPVANQMTKNNLLKSAIKYSIVVPFVHLSRIIAKRFSDEI